MTYTDSQAFIRWLLCSASPSKRSDPIIQEPGKNGNFLDYKMIKRVASRLGLRQENVGGNDRGHYVIFEDAATCSSDEPIVAIQLVYLPRRLAQLAIHYLAGRIPLLEQTKAVCEALRIPALETPMCQMRYRPDRVDDWEVLVKLRLKEVQPFFVTASAKDNTIRLSFLPTRFEKSGLVGVFNRIGLASEGSNGVPLRALINDVRGLIDYELRLEDFARGCEELELWVNHRGVVIKDVVEKINNLEKCLRVVYKANSDIYAAQQAKQGALESVKTIRLSGINEWLREP